MSLNPFAIPDNESHPLSDERSGSAKHMIEDLVAEGQTLCIKQGSKEIYVWATHLGMPYNIATSLKDEDITRKDISWEQVIEELATIGPDINYLGFC
jgi:hypothetical protein